MLVNMRRTASQWTPKYLDKLYDIYNSEVEKVLEKKYGKDFFQRTKKEFYDKGKKQKKNQTD